ncbi:secretin receptor isoform X2 [Dipodomys spectabilis]|uniref:secretin receptor isoform X2 n=1 Tax=Dipodomys spectabilis TaxID=105255 RepID=UPI001C543C50|nr:secretin receptor isoform X2 [Dipodomys spectabilis]
MRPCPPPLRVPVLLLVLLSGAARTVGVLPRLCDVLRVMQEEQTQCLQELSRDREDASLELPVPGCEGLWDNMSCWPSSAPGQIVEVECPRFFQMLTGRNGSLFRNCTQDGWSETFPRPDLACGVNVNDSSNDKRHEYLLKLKVMYTVGYSSSLVMLLAALSILCAFRRLHCTRNYIHMHLFVSFILRALSNFIKDAVLFSSDDVTYCDPHRVGCKLVMIFFQYCIMANYAWLLVEGLYLHTLLAISFFSEKKCLQGFVTLGWGSPAIFVALWAITRYFLEDVGCWDINANATIWWVIRGPVILSILINFIFFINILRILMRKLRTQETRGSEMNQYKGWSWPSSTASSTARYSWKFRRSGDSGTCKSSRCAPWPSAPPSAMAPSMAPRVKAPAGPVSSETAAGLPRVRGQARSWEAQACYRTGIFPTAATLCSPVTACIPPLKCRTPQKQAEGTWGQHGEDKGPGLCV